MIEAADIKIAVLQVALGIKALEDKALFDKLEEFWISAYSRGRADARDWIKCSDRLPTEGGSYIVFAPSADLDKPLITNAWYEPQGGKHMPGWQLLPKVWCAAITHWMPLPTAPDGRAESDK